METTTSNFQKFIDSIADNNTVSHIADAFCEKHGTYRAKVFKSGRVEKCTHCTEEQQKAEQARLFELKNKELEHILGKSGIPKRNQNCRVNNYHTNGNERKNQLKDLVKKYTEDFLSGSLKRNLVLLGNCGNGKTHLACAVGMAGLANNKTVLFSTASEIIRRIQATYKSKTETEFELIKKYAEIDLLIIDEVGIQYATDSAGRVITEIVNARYENELPTIFISNLSLDKFSAVMGNRVMSRMLADGCKPFICDWEDYRTNQNQNIQAA